MAAQLPLRPKLRGYYRVIPVQEDKLLLQGGGNTLVLSGDSVREFIPRLISYLDGDLTVEQILLRLPDVEPNVVLEALTFFQERNLLEDIATKITDIYHDRYAYQTSFWLSISNDRYHYQNKLAKAQVAIFGLGAIGSMVASSLALAGVGRIDLIDRKKVAAADQLSGSYTLQHIGQYRAVVMKEYLTALNDLIHCESLTGDTGEVKDIIPLLDGCDMALVCSDSPTTITEELLNEAALELDIPWSRGSIDHYHGVIGPTVIPKQTACFTCFNLRLRSNATYIEDAVAYDKHLREHESMDEEVALLVPCAGLIAHHLALETLKVITGFAYPISAGAFLSLNSFTGELTRHVVLKLPRCPGCSIVSNYPRMKIWDISTAMENNKRPDHISAI